MGMRRGAYGRHSMYRMRLAQVQCRVAGEVAIDAVYGEPIPAHEHEKAVLVVIVRTHDLKFCLYVSV
eukprot:2670120-Pleurochrysis_carterae.AAC.1